MLLTGPASTVDGAERRPVDKVNQQQVGLADGLRERGLVQARAFGVAGTSRLRTQYGECQSQTANAGEHTVALIRHPRREGVRGEKAIDDRGEGCP